MALRRDVVWPGFFGLMAVASILASVALVNAEQKSIKDQPQQVYIVAQTKTVSDLPKINRPFIRTADSYGYNKPDDAKVEVVYVELNYASVRCASRGANWGELRSSAASLSPNAKVADVEKIFKDCTAIYPAFTLPTPPA